MADTRSLDVPPFLLDTDATDCGIHAIASLLRALGFDEVDHATLKAIGGDGFKFVYDRSEVFEPMRDLTPTDFVRDTLAAFGVQGSWRTGLSLEEVDEAIIASLDAGVPVLTSNLLDVSNGYQLIVGCEPGDVPRVAVRGGLLAADLEEDASPTRPARWIPLDADWNGPVSSRARWGLNPLFIVESRDKDARSPAPLDRMKLAAEAGLRVGEVFEIPYGTSGLEEAHAREPVAGRSAAHGAEAWAVLAEEIRDRPDLVATSFIWRVDTVTRRLAHDRNALADFFADAARHAGKRKNADAQKDALDTLARVCRDIAEQAHALRTLVWNETALDAESPDAVQKQLTSSLAVAFALPEGDERLVEALGEMGYADRIVELTRGPAVLMDDVMRWREVLAAVERLTDLEADLEAGLPRLVG